jgi:predicted RecB family nuclease
MRIRNEMLTLSATDLANHLSCTHLTTVNLLLAKGELAEPSWDNPHLEILQQRGLEHETAYVQSLQSRGLAVVDLSGEAEATAADATSAAMKGGAPAIVQGTLSNGLWRGRADVLLRVDSRDKQSRFGQWSYEVVDCKLARQTKAETILQLCLYSELVGEVQGIAPVFFHVIRPNVGFEPESYRLSSFAAYCRFVKSALQEVLNGGSEKTYPEPVSHCEICRWWKECDKRRRSDDHLSFVAGASKLQRNELDVQRISTLKDLARLPLPIPFTPTRGAIEGYGRIREQARIQFEARTEGRLKFESLGVVPSEGLCRLPAPSPADVFLDLEGDPFVGEGGLEYLFGIITANDVREPVYKCRWAFDRTEERAAFEWFIDFIMPRLVATPDLHIYHFGSYEPSAVKRLMLRYAAREEEVDRLLRGKVFIDLHTIIKQSVRASVEQYSLKDMERFCEYSRSVPLPEASQARHFIEHQLELGSCPSLTDEACRVVQGYNRDDCQATEAVRNWLETLRSNLIIGGADIARPARPDAAASENTTAHRERVAAIFEALTADLPSEPKDRTPEQAAQWLLAYS